MQRIDIPEKDIREALKTAGSVTAAAVLLGISRMTMYRLMTRYGIEIKRIVA
jgi:transcriptional regulator of acetoin/glycerol metabolism